MINSDILQVKIIWKACEYALIDLKENNNMNINKSKCSNQVGGGNWKLNAPSMKFFAFLTLDGDVLYNESER